MSQVTAARGGESTSAASDTDSTALELTTLDGFSLFTSTSGSTAEESSVAALPAADQGVQAIVVKGASSAVLAAIQTADIVAYVVPDLKIRAATAGEVPGPCTGPAPVANLLQLLVNSRNSSRYVHGLAPAQLQLVSVICGFRVRSATRVPPLAFAAQHAAYGCSRWCSLPPCCTGKYQLVLCRS